MSFNSDISKQGHEIKCSHKRSVASHSPFTFTIIPVAQTNSQKHLGMELDKKYILKNILAKLNQR